MLRITFRFGSVVFKISLLNMNEAYLKGIRCLNIRWNTYSFLTLVKSDKEESTEVAEPESERESTSFGFVSNRKIASFGSYRIMLAFGENETPLFGVKERSNARRVSVSINSGLSNLQLWLCILKWKDLAVSLFGICQRYPPPFYFGELL
jgi:hypothetical protein